MDKTQMEGADYCTCEYPHVVTEKYNSPRGKVSYTTYTCANCGQAVRQNKVAADPRRGKPLDREAKPL